MVKEILSFIALSDLVSVQKCNRFLCIHWWAAVVSWAQNIEIIIWYITAMHQMTNRSCPHTSVLVAQSCLTLCDTLACSLPGSSVHGILQAIILELVAIPFSRGSSWSRDRTQVSCLAGIFFTVWATRELSFYSMLKGYRLVPILL